MLRLSLAALFGALIGLERERKNLTAGLRTHMMVCVGSSLIMIVSAFGFADILGTEHVGLDPSRVAAQVVSGIGFIGAGTILLMKQGTIHGLTTAAGMWTVAAIGLATGGGLYFAAAATTVIALIILWALQPFEKRFSRRFKKNSLLIVSSDTNILNWLMENTSLPVSDFSVSRNNGEVIMEIRFERVDRKLVEQIIGEIKKNPSITEVSWAG